VTVSEVPLSTEEQPKRQNPLAETPVREHEGGFGQELRIFGQFGGQIAASQIVQFLIVLTDVAMMARLGGLSLSAGLLINSVYIVIYVTAFGLMQGTLPAAARAAAMGDNAVFRTVSIIGWHISLLVGLFLSLAVVSFALVLEPLGYDAVFAVEGASYALWIFPGYFLSVLLIAFRNILISIGKTQLFSVIAIGSAIVNAALNYVFAFGALDFPAMGLGGIGLATTVVDVLLFALFGALALLVLKARRPEDTSPTEPMLPSVLRIGIPTAGIFFVETMLFTGMLFLVGRSDTGYLASLGLIFQYETMAMMVPIGLSQAAVQRASVALAEGGAAALAKLNRVTQAALVMVVLYLSLLAVLQFLFEINFPELLVAGAPLDASILDAIDRAQAFTFAIIVFHAMIIVVAGILRGIEDVQASLRIVVICYWGAGLGLGFMLIEVAEYGVERSVEIVAFAMLLSMLSIFLKLNTALRSR
jgi:MATE family multidrug resistance protein